jgi:hypothetical protein
MPSRLVLTVVLLAASTPLAPAATPPAGQPLALTGVLTDMTSGRSFDMASTRGKRTLVFLWVTWCRECKDYVADMNALQRELQGATDRLFLSICGDNGLDGLDTSDLTPQATALAVRQDCSRCLPSSIRHREDQSHRPLRRRRLPKSPSPGRVRQTCRVLDIRGQLQPVHGQGSLLLATETGEHYRPIKGE